MLSDDPGASETHGGAPTFADLDIDLDISGLAPMGRTWRLVHPDTPDEATATLRAAMGATMARE